MNEPLGWVVKNSWLSLQHTYLLYRLIHWIKKKYQWISLRFQKTCFTKAHLAHSLGNLFVLRPLVTWIWCPIVCGLLLEQGFLNLIERMHLMCKEGTEATISLPSFSFRFEKPVIILCMVLCIYEEFYNIFLTYTSFTDITCNMNFSVTSWQLILHIYVYIAAFVF